MGTGGRLSVVAGPIGNLADLSPRAREVLASADLVLSEDTRVSGRLLQEAGVKRPQAVLHDHTPPAKIVEFVDLVRSGQSLALLTDAGTPGISDPGAQLVDSLLEEGLAVEPIPGPSAVTAALSVSGFFAQRFAFLGFLPRKPGPAKEVLAPFAESSLTIVLFESPHRFTKTLQVCHEALGERRYAVCREMTKVHGQVWRSELPTLPVQAEVPAKGEFTLVIEGSRKRKTDK